MAPQMHLGSTAGVGMPSNMGGVVNLQDFKLPAAPANDSSNTGTSAQGNMQRRDSFMDSISGLPGMNNNMNQNGNFY